MLSLHCFRLLLYFAFTESTYRKERHSSQKIKSFLFGCTAVRGLSGITEELRNRGTHLTETSKFSNADQMKIMGGVVPLGLLRLIYGCWGLVG